jgi:hypothetical protein
VVDSPFVVPGPPLPALRRSATEILETARKLGKASVAQTESVSAVQIDLAVRQMEAVEELQKRLRTPGATSQEIEELNVLRSELRETIKDFDGSTRGNSPTPRPPRLWTTEVRVKVGDVDNAKDYEIRYCSSGAYRVFKGKSFDSILSLTPNARQDLPFGKFVFWAVDPRFPTTPVARREGVVIGPPSTGQTPLVVPLVASERGRR